MEERAATGNIRPKVAFGMFMRHQFANLRDYLQSLPIVR
jgi:hypothetical protein